MRRWPKGCHDGGEWLIDLRGNQPNVRRMGGTVEQGEGG